MSVDIQLSKPAKVVMSSSRLAIVSIGYAAKYEHILELYVNECIVGLYV